MSRWRRLSRKRRASYLAIASFVLATTGWAANRWTSSWEEASVSPVPISEEPSDLKSPLDEEPAAAFVQKTSAAPDRGNVVVTLQLTSDQLSRRQAEGSADFITLGDLKHQVIFRNDGVAPDAVAGDLEFSAYGTIDEGDLREKADEDARNLTESNTKDVPVFDDREIVGTETPEPFDFAGFQAGARVRLDQAVAFLEPESSSSETTTNTATKGSLSATTAASFVPGTNLFQERVLILRSLPVVTDPARTFDPCTGGGNPNGVWTYNHLATTMANPAASGIDPSLFVENWLRHWLSTQVINADRVPSRIQMQQIINQWKNESGGVKLDLAKAPLRLLAILPRVDLRKTSAGGGSYSNNISGKFLDAGELRFVFGFVLKPGWSDAGFIGAVPIPGTNNCRALPFSLIIEYKVPKCECKAVRDWARRWVDLRLYTPGTAAYNGRVEKLTEEVVHAGANPTEPNFNNLGQKRTNEVAIAPLGGTPYGDPGGPTWELREFQLTQFPFTFLTETTVADTPEDAYNQDANGTGLLKQWILNAIPNGPPPVPLFFGGRNFLAGNSIVPDPPPLLVHHWNDPTLDLTIPAVNNARFQVSLAACNGCHRGETGTHFVHIDPSNSIPGANPALPAEISGFLSGIQWADPAHGAPVRTFDDLARREKDIKQVARMACFRFHPVHVAHVQDNLKATGKLPPDLFAGLPPLPSELRVPIGVEDLRRKRVKAVH
jgi:hypothetical protein